MTVENRLHARCRCHSSREAHEDHEGGAAGRPFAFASSPRNFERDRPFSIEHLALDVALDLEKKRVSATATLKVRRVSPTATAIVLDAVGFTIERVEVSGKFADYTYDDRELRVELGAVEDASVRVVYTCAPRRGLYFIEPDEHRPHLPRQVSTQCQEEDARHFVPCHDKPHVKDDHRAVGGGAHRLGGALERPPRLARAAQRRHALPLEDGRAAPELLAHPRGR